MTLGDIELVGQAGEINNSLEVEGKINIQMNPEQRILGHGIEFTVELLVFIFGNLPAADRVQSGFLSLTSSPSRRMEIGRKLQNFFNTALTRVTLQKLLFSSIEVEDDFCPRSFLSPAAKLVAGGPLRRSSVPLRFRPDRRANGSQPYRQP